MNQTSVGLLGLAVVLGAALAAELALPEAPPQAVAPPPLPSPGKPASVGAPDTDDWVDTILARPLFNPDRKPAAAAPRAAENMAAAPVGPIDLPRLAGVMVTPAGSKAIFAPAQGKAVVAGPGGQVGAYVVKSIAAGQVVLAGGEGERVIRPTYLSGPPMAAARPNAPPPAARPAGTPPDQ